MEVLAQEYPSSGSFITAWQYWWCITKPINIFRVTFQHVAIRDALILLAIFLEKYVGKSKEQNAGKIGGKLEKWAPRNSNLAQLA